MVKHNQGLSRLQHDVNRRAQKHPHLTSSHQFSHELFELANTTRLSGSPRQPGHKSPNSRDFELSRRSPLLPRRITCFLQPHSAPWRWIALNWIAWSCLELLGVGDCMWLYKSYFSNISQLLPSGSVLLLAATQSAIGWCLHTNIQNKVCYHFSTRQKSIAPSIWNRYSTRFWWACDTSILIS